VRPTAAARFVVAHAEQGYTTNVPLSSLEDDLALLAGDYLYARGLERLAALQDLVAVRELSDLISLAAQLHSGAQAVPDGNAASALWLASVTAVTVAADADHERGKRDLRLGRPGATVALWRSAQRAAEGAGVSGELELAAESIGFHPL
jgi:hypothetical protein